MSNRRRRFEPALSDAPSLFDMTDGTPGTLDQTSLVKAAMAEAIRRSPYKRLDIAFRLSTFLGYVVSEDMLNQMTSAKEEYQLKVSQLNAFCRAVGNLVVYDELLRSEGLRLLNPQDEPAIRLGQALKRKQEAEQEIQRAQRDLEGQR